MTNKELLKIKLAASRKSLNSITPDQAREILSGVLANGTERDRNLVKEAAKGKSILDALSKGTSGVKSATSLLKDLAAAAAIGKAGLEIGKSAIKAQKLKKMSPLRRALVKSLDASTPQGKVLRYGGGAAALGLGISALDKGVSAVTTPLHKKRSFNRMMKDNPSLKKENPRDLKRAFNTLHRFNPKMASDPLVAGSFMKRTMQFKDEGIQPVDIKTLTSIRSDDKKESILGKAFLGGASQLANFVG